MLLVSVGDLSGSGGTERQFADLFDYLRSRRGVAADLVTSSVGAARLRAAGRLHETAGVIELPLGAQPARGKAGVGWLTLLLLWQTLRHRWDVVHVCQPTPAYVPYCAIVSRLPQSWRPRVAITVVDCTLAHHLQSGAKPSDIYEQQVVAAHRLYFRWARIDAVFSWYRAFVEAARSLGLLPSALMAAARFCFTDVTRYQPGDKQPLIVYAGRLSNQKRPLLFVDAVASLRRRYPELIAGWQFKMYGSGPLESQVRERIRDIGLVDVIELTRTPQMAPVFAASKAFVSTQAFENFTSLAMLEAMAAGNAVIAENAGQTSEFVAHRDNGLLVDSATGDGFADAIAEYLRHREWHDRMAASSRRIATEVQTVEHFADDILSFWRRVVAS